MKTAELDYALPQALIARHPLPERSAALLMVCGERIDHRRVAELPELLAPGTLLVVNDTRVLPARLFGKKRPNGGKVELLLVNNVSRADSEELWLALGRSHKPLRAGTVIDVGEITATIERARDPDGLWLVALRADDVAGARARLGHVPLPPYLGRADEPADRDRYQTIFAREPGAVAAPTAGLHFDEPLLARLRDPCEVASITLHVGPGTFAPVHCDDLDDHPMHAERFAIPERTAAAIARARARGGAILAVGTTVVRALESAADPARPGCVRAMSGETRLLIQPGHPFAVVDALLTNFHLPRSTLLALVFAFGGAERVAAAYREAIAQGYRFYSYGDAMLLHREPSAVSRSVLASESR